MKVWMSIDRLAARSSARRMPRETRPSVIGSMPVSPGWRATSGAMAWPSVVPAVSCSAYEAVRPSSGGSGAQPAMPIAIARSQAETVEERCRPMADPSSGGRECVLRTARRSG
jgi:hypothetical protein